MPDSPAVIHLFRQLPVVILLLLGMLSSSAFAASSPQHLQGWEYRWGDSPVHDGSPLWTQNREPRAWQAIDFPSNPPKRQGQTHAWYRTQLPDNHWQDPVIYIYSIDLIAEVYLGTEKIYTFGEFDQEGHGRFQGWPWHLIELPEGFSGQTLHFRVYSDYTDIGLWGEVKILERSHLLLEIIQSSYLDLLVIVFCTLMGLIAFAFAFMQTNRRPFIYLGLLTLAVGSKLLGENQAVQLVMDAPLFRTYLTAAGYFLLPVFIALLLSEWFQNKGQGLMKKLALAHLVYLVLALGLSLIGVLQLSITYPLFDGLFILTLMVLLYLTAKNFQNLNQDQRLVMSAFWVLAVFLLVDMAVAHGFLPWARFPLSIGVLVFALTLMVISMREYQRTQKALHQLNASLEDRIRQRTASLQTYAQLERQRSNQLTLLNRHARELEELVAELQSFQTLEQAGNYLHQQLPQTFQPYKIRIQLLDKTVPGTNTTDSTPSPYQWFLTLEDIHLGAQTFAKIHLNPDPSLTDQHQLEQLNSFMGRVAERLSMSLTSLKIRQNLQRLSYEDALTGLKNRRFMDEALEREIALAKRNKRPLSLLICDIDHFKNFNDSHGHEAGDWVLYTLSQVLLEHFRETDIPCRFGGEEFVVLLPGTGKETAVIRAQELLDKVTSSPLTYLEQDLGQITISLGVASWPDQALNPDELLKAADKALYRAKQKGRNRVEVAGNNY
ncbi:diguanylate cyclase [Marinospirillum sp.]|uniref:diguanylate cyclase n=1 Tax=Marinospirillum sp. TaxID=2183934 RepID=UPI0038502A52